MSLSYEDTLVALAAADPSLIVMTAENRAAIRGRSARLPDRLRPPLHHTHSADSG